MKIRKYVFAGIAVILLTVLIVLSVRTFGENNRDVVLTVGDEKVYLPEAMVYWKLMQSAYESIGGEEVWEMDMLGLDPSETAMERVLESLVRVKVVQGITPPIKTADEALIMEKCQELKEFLGQDYCDRFGIRDELIEEIVRENFRAYRYEETADFRTSEFETQIAEGMEAQFGRYETYEQEQYLQTAVIYTMMFYTGQWNGDTWVSYPEAQRDQILTTAESVLAITNQENFLSIAKTLSDDAQVIGNPVFEAGAIKNEAMRFGNVYYGQMLSEAAEVIFASEIGDITKIIETPYGYLICYVTGFREAREGDFASYQEQLQREKAAYRSQLIHELKAQRMEQEWQRLTDENVIVYNRTRFSEYLQENGFFP